MKPKRGLIVGGIIAGIVLLIILISVIWTVSTYNGLVERENEVEGDWAEVQNQYQRKLDLIEQLVEEVSKYQEFESGTLENITALRSQFNSADSQGKVGLSDQIEQARMSIYVVIEDYPDLYSIDAVLTLMDEMTGTENRITVARGRYIDSVKDYNTKIEKFPTVIIANMFGFDEMDYYITDSASVSPP